MEPKQQYNDIAESFVKGKETFFEKRKTLVIIFTR